MELKWTSSLAMLCRRPLQVMAMTPTQPRWQPKAISQKALSQECLSASPQWWRNRMAGLNQAHLSGGHQAGVRRSTSTITIGFDREPRERINSRYFQTCGDVRTVCERGQLKEALDNLNQQGTQADSNTYVSVLKECIKMKDLAEGKEVHAHIIQSGFKPNIVLLNTLVNMYAKCGSVVDARQVFDKMLERDMFTWTTMIGGYAKHGYGREALKLYEQMQQEGLAPTMVTFICVLNACARLGVLEKGKEVHADLVKAGIEPDVMLETALADMYAKCNSMKDARQVFDNMTHRNVVSWNAVITGYAQQGCGKEALEMYNKMQQERVVPDRVTFTCILLACSKLGALTKGREVHADIIKAGIAPDVILDTALVDMYAKCANLRDARKMFDNLAKRNVVTWNAMITGYAQHGCFDEALELYVQMQRDVVTPDRVTFVCILNVCASLRALEKGKLVHADISRSQIAPDIILDNALVDMYAKCGSMKNARQVFNNMVRQDVVSWNAMITGYAQHGLGREAFETYTQMQQERVKPSTVTFISILNACASLGALEKGKGVHADIIKGRIASCFDLETALVDMYAKCGSIKDARNVFDTMVQRDVVSWTVMIGVYAQHGCGREAFEIYEQMQLDGVTPNRVTFTCLLKACASLGSLEKVKEVLADISKWGIARDIILENTLLDIYAKCGSMEDARELFDNMALRNVHSWSAIIAGCAQHGHGKEAVELFEQMQREGCKPNGITFISLLFACGHGGLVDEGRQYFNSMSRDYGVTPTMEHFGCMVDLLGRAGRLDEAEDFICRMPIEPDAGVWMALLSACRIHGDVKVAERAARSIVKSDPQNAAALALLSKIHAAAGRWNNERRLTT